MPPGDDLELVRRLYRTGVVGVRDGDGGSPQLFVDVERANPGVQRYVPPWLLETPQEQDERYQMYTEAVLRVWAEDKIRAVWEGDGGPRSSVGLPKTPQLSALRSGEGWSSDFRSGRITLQGNQCAILTTRELVVQFVGLECNVRQEGVDELYGVVAVIGPANKQIATFAFPGGDGTIEMGPDGQRIWTTNHDLYRGPIEDVVLVATLVEHDDFTDVDAAARRIADKIAEVGGQAVGALTGVPAEQVTSETWFRDGLAEAVGFVLDDIFGAGDDPYPGQSLRVPWDEIGEWGPPRQPPRTRSDDPKQIPRWTQRIKVTGRDDAGDTGDYDFYVDMWVEQRETWRNCPIPP